MLGQHTRNHKIITAAVGRVRFAQSTCAFVREKMDQDQAEVSEYKDMLKVVAFYRKQLTMAVKRFNYPLANFAGLID